MKRPGDKMSGTTLKPWNKLVRLRDDVRSGALSLQEFAADLFDVINRTGKRPLYEQPARFFPLTFATLSLREIVAGTAERLRGKSAKAIRQLEMTYGGGKTHTLVTLTHMFREPETLPDVASVREFESAMGGQAPKARIAAVCFDKLDLESGIRAIAPDGTARMLKHPWSVIAFQLAGADGLRMLHPDGEDIERETPPRDGGPLEEVLSAPAKEGLGTLILFDEVLMYVSEKARHPVTGSLFRTEFVNFLQSLTQAVAKVDTASLLVSLLASDPNKDDEFGRQLLADMSNVLGRKEDESFLPVGKDDVAEVLRRRLLDPETTKDPEAFRPSVVAVVRALAALDPEFARSPAQREQQEKRYLASFPFDPSLMDVFYTKWTSDLPLFQRTRGVLRTFAVALRDAEAWDTAPVAGVSILLSRPGEAQLTNALRDLADTARVGQIAGSSQDWNAILQGELGFARAVQDQHPALGAREIEQAVVAVFLHSQPAGGNRYARITELTAMAGMARPDRITFEKALQGWAERSWYLDELHLASADKRADGSRTVPKTWRLGNQPNLKQMHDDARQNRVSAPAVEDMLLEQIKGARWLDQGANALGAKVHKLPTDPGMVPGDGEFRYVILGPNAVSESGKPSALATRFCEEVSGPDNPRAAKNAIVVAVPDRTGLAQARDKVRDLLAWRDVRDQLKDKEVDPVRSANLRTVLDGAERDIDGAIRQAYCVVVTRAADDSIQAFKVTVDERKPLFTTIKEDKKSRIEDVTLAPDLLLPGGQYDLWREDEERRRVKTIVGAFAERPKLPKMLRRKDLLDTVANGAEQGLFVLTLARPDGSARTWWRTRIDETALTDDNLEAVQNRAATLESLDPALLAPGTLEGLAWDKGVKVSDLAAYFAGHTLTIEHEDEGWTEQRAIPRCPEAAILAAVASAVTAGTVWLTNGPASVWGETPPAGVVSKAAMLRAPPEPIAVSALMPAALPDAWTDGKATVASIMHALAAQKAVAALPWRLIERAIGSALQASFVRVVPGAVGWPCEPHEAGALELALPEIDAPFDIGGDGGAKPVRMGFSEPVHYPTLQALGEAVLDSSGVSELADAMTDILEAAGSLTLRFRVIVEYGEGEYPTAPVRAAVAAALGKVADDFNEM